MPITLGCPACGKRFRARDESTGKKVKCPFCQAPVGVPSAEDSQNAGAPTEVVAADSDNPDDKGSLLYDPMKAPSRPVAASNAAEWGAGDPPPPPKPFVLEEEPPAFLPMSPPKGNRPPVAVPPPVQSGKPKKPAKPPKSPEELAAAGWKKARAGLFWVLFALFWFALMGFVPFGKLVYERFSGKELPKGDGSKWVEIEGYVNTPGPDAIQLEKQDMLDLLAYGVPVLLGGFALSLGRVTAGAAPRNSGAKGLFAFSGLITLIALAGLVTWKVCEKVAFREIAGYGWWSALLGGALGEFWFLLALGAAGATLRRPSAVRTVGCYALVVGLAVAIYFVGWDLYKTELGPKIGRPKVLDADWQFYEAAATLLGWMVLVGTYWRAVRGVRIAIKEHVAE